MRLGGVKRLVRKENVTSAVQRRPSLRGVSRREVCTVPMVELTGGIQR